MKLCLRIVCTAELHSQWLATEQLNVITKPTYNQICVWTLTSCKYEECWKRNCPNNLEMNFLHQQKKKEKKKSNGNKTIEKQLLSFASNVHRINDSCICILSIRHRLYRTIWRLLCVSIHSLNIWVCSPWEIDIHLQFNIQKNLVLYSASLSHTVSRSLSFILYIIKLFRELNELNYVIV